MIAKIADSPIIRAIKFMRFPFVCFAVASVVPLSCGAGSAIGPSKQETEALHNRCADILREVLQKGQRFVKIHAGEALVMTDYSEGVAEAFQQELVSHANDPEYRVTIWRVLARCPGTEAERQQWVEKIREAFLDTNGPDRGHAAEALGKLGYKPRAKGDEEFAKVAQSSDEALATLSRWVLANSGKLADEALLAEMLFHTNGALRGYAAYGFSYRPKLGKETQTKLMAAVNKEPADSKPRIRLAGAASRHAPKDQKPLFRAELVRFLSDANLRQRYAACAALAKSGVRENVPALIKLLDDPDLDVRGSAANAILQIDKGAGIP